MMPRAPSETVLPDQLREISALDRVACVDRWTATFGTAPTKYLSIDFMQRVLARDLQVKSLGGYSTQVRRALTAVLQQIKSADSSSAVRPGSYLLREWNGRTFRVEVTGTGYVLDGVTFASLSTVAKKITGAHWSGPRFFGLTPKRAN